MNQKADFKYAWRIPSADNRQFQSFVEMVTRYPDVCDEVWLFMVEPTSYGYHPLDQVKEACRIIEGRLEALRKLGIRAGINLWPTFGAEDSVCDPDPRPPLPYPHMVSADGKVTHSLACPSSPAFHAYIREKFHIMASTHPDFIWVDDDCRLTHLGAFYPCFCSECVRRFQNGRFASREQLVEALNRPENTSLRHDWCAYNADRLAEFCTVVRAAVDEIDPAIETPFMSVGYSHTTYGGDYLEKCTAALRSKSARPGHGFYWDDRPRDLFTKTMEVARQVQRLPQQARNDVLLEEESHPRIPLDKAVHTRMLEIGAALSAGCTGVAFNHLFDGGGEKPMAYLAPEMDVLHDYRPMFQRYTAFAKGLPMAGLWPIDNQWMMAGMPVDEKGWFREGSPGYTFDTADSWATYGFALTADPEHAYANILHGLMVETFSDQQIQELFQKPVVMDAEALGALERRGLGYLAGASLGQGRLGVEEVLARHPLSGDYWGSSRSALFPRCYELTPLPGWKGEALSYAKSPYETLDSPCSMRLTKEGRAPVVIFGYGPYRFIGSPGKLLQMRGLARDMGAPLLLEPRPDTYTPGRITPFVRMDKDRAAVTIINAFLDPAQQVDLEIKTTASKVTLLRPGMPEKEMPCTRKGEWLVIPIERMEPWEIWMLLVE